MKALGCMLLALLQADEPQELRGLRELAELGLDAELARTGPPLLAPGGALETDGEAAALVARALFAAGRESDAFATLDRSRPATEAGRVSVALMRARLFLELDRLQEALRLLVDNSSGTNRPRYPDRPESLLLLGRALVRSDRRATAEPLLAGFVERVPLHPEAPDAWHMLFEAALDRGDHERARHCRDQKERWSRWHALLQARRLQVRRDPNARLPRLGLALLWIDAGALDPAKAALDELLARYPTDAEAWLHLGEVHRLAGRLPEAAVAYRRALDHRPQEHRARFSLALVHRLVGRPAEARRELETLLADAEAERDERFLTAHLELARLLVAAGEAGAAERRYARYRELGGSEPLGPAD